MFSLVFVMVVAMEPNLDAAEVFVMVMAEEESADIFDDMDEIRFALRFHVLPAFLIWAGLRLLACH